MVWGLHLAMPPDERSKNSPAFARVHPDGQRDLSKDPSERAAERYGIMGTGTWKMAGLPKVRRSSCVEEYSTVECYCSYVLTFCSTSLSRISFLRKLFGEV